MPFHTKIDSNGRPTWHHQYEIAYSKYFPTIQILKYGIKFHASIGMWQYFMKIWRRMECWTITSSKYFPLHFFLCSIFMKRQYFFRSLLCGWHSKLHVYRDFALRTVRIDTFIELCSMEQNVCPSENNRYIASMTSICYRFEWPHGMSLYNTGMDISFWLSKQWFCSSYNLSILDANSFIFSSLLLNKFQPIICWSSAFNIY